MVSDIARSLAFKPVVVDASTMQIASENRVAIAVRPVVSQVDHRAHVGVTAAGFAVLALAVARVGPMAAGPVEMIGTGFHERVTMRGQILAVHPLKMGAGNHVEKVRQHAVGDERFAQVVEIKTPGVGRAVGNCLKDRAWSDDNARRRS